MKKLLLFCLLPALTCVLPVTASTTSDESEFEPQIESGIQLPGWEAGEPYESFDVRIWPEEVIIWLEQENLRDIIADPSTPEAERNELKRILAMQQAWRHS